MLPKYNVGDLIEFVKELDPIVEKTICGECKKEIIHRHISSRKVQEKIAHIFIQDDGNSDFDWLVSWENHKFTYQTETGWFVTEEQILTAEKENKIG